MLINNLYEIFLEYPVICTDSRNIIPDSIFFALKGEHFDGNKYVKQVLNEGCAYAISDNKENENIHGCIIVPNVLDALQQLANYHRNELNTPIIAITGTNGKTTTKELLTAVLASKYKVVATKGNLNNHIGVPLTLLSITKETQIAVVEMGANHIGEIAELCRIAQPNAGLITNIGKAHLEGFGSEEGVRQTKGELYDFLNDNRGIIFYNNDDATLKKMAENTEKAQHIPYGKTIYNAVLSNSDFLEFTTEIPVMTVKTHLVGSYNLNNALAAIATGLHYEIPAEEIQNSLNNYIPANNRSQLIKTEHNTIIMDAYNANPSSMEAAIINFSNLNNSNKLLILGDMLELGNDSPAEHKNVIELLKKYNLVKNAILIGNHFYEFKNPDSTFFQSRADAATFLENNKIHANTILIKGSRGIGLENLLKYL